MEHRLNRQIDLVKEAFRCNVVMLKSINNYKTIVIYGDIICIVNITSYWPIRSPTYSHSLNIKLPIPDWHPMMDLRAIYNYCCQCKQFNLFTFINQFNLDCDTITIIKQLLITIIID